MSYNPIEIATIENQSISFDLANVGVYAFKHMQHRLPQGFQEVEYIQSSGTQCIDTAVGSSTNIIIDIQFLIHSVTPSTPGEIIGGGNYWPSNNMQLGFNTGSSGSTGLNIRYLKNANYQNGVYSSNLPLNEKFTVHFAYPYTSMTISPSRTLTPAFTSSISFSTSNTLGMFAYHRGGSWGEYSKIRVYECKISNQSSTLRNFIPCYCTEQKTGYKGTTVVTVDANTIGLYDLVNNRFYVNCGSGTFIKGEDI